MVLHPEGEDVAVLLASEAVEVAVRGHGEGGLGLLVEGAGGDKARSQVLERHEAPDQVDDGKALLYQLYGVAALHVQPSLAPARAASWKK